MKVFVGVFLCAMGLYACGDAGEPGVPRAVQACNDICNLPDQCFEELGVPVQGSDCVSSCEAQIDVVGVDCIVAITDTIDCLGTCDVDALTQEELLACQDAALAIGPACDDA